MSASAQSVTGGGPLSLVFLCLSVSLALSLSLPFSVSLPLSPCCPGRTEGQWALKRLTVFTLTRCHLQKTGHTHTHTHTKYTLKYTLTHTHTHSDTQNTHSNTRSHTHTHILRHTKYTLKYTLTHTHAFTPASTHTEINTAYPRSVALSSPEQSSPSEHSRDIFLSCCFHCYSFSTNLTHVYFIAASLLCIFASPLRPPGARGSAQDVRCMPVPGKGRHFSLAFTLTCLPQSRQRRAHTCHVVTAAKKRLLSISSIKTPLILIIPLSVLFACCALLTIEQTPSSTAIYKRG